MVEIDSFFLWEPNNRVQNCLHSTDLKAVKKSLGPGSTATPECGVSPGPDPLQTKPHEDFLGFQCQVVGPSHSSLISMQDAATTKQPAQNLFTAQKFQLRIRNKVETTSFAPFPTCSTGGRTCIVSGHGCAEMSTKRAHSSW
jgi:hypothetical protein